MLHHPVIRNDKETTKLRIVFDASTKEKNCLSLNNNLKAEPNLNPNILILLLKFRKFRIGLISDVEKAFLQIVLAEKDRDCQRFLWADDFPPNNLKFYRNKTVTFSVKSSPFFLAATIKHHIKNYERSHPLAYKEIWEGGFDWDEELGKNLRIKWEKWGKEVHSLVDLSIPRYYFKADESSEEFNEYQIVIFCDASERAYGAIAYIRYKTNSDFHVNFVSSKARIAPLKKLSLPRLELLATLIGARLIETLRKVHEIQDLTNLQNWRFVKGEQNPADIVSRGCSAEELLKNRRLWHGPHWLTLSEENWPKNERFQETTNEERVKYIAINYSSEFQNEEPILDINNFSFISKVF
ncbi:uncharacterized protein TNIN_18601 [Trichonephila inaurata madagascariensis]|uniref:Uncharacterized protein n=1 Tax=Trichonephila inaurata madagascariensis TaxID=2747483 RepID=A0A8X7CJM2_9ARAC|nr:uncharacterized protein TNIN_18601 [Trichonephila inaurata madagascariensis]